MAETRVDLLHLLEDLRDAYPGALEETILTEILANALDSGASLIRISTDSASASLTIVDNGSGMPRHELRRYHDLATSTKTRGQGIGFAGVGIKLALLACKEVITETRRGATHVASQWHMAARHKARRAPRTPSARRVTARWVSAATRRAPERAPRARALADAASSRCTLREARRARPTCASSLRGTSSHAGHAQLVSPPTKPLAPRHSPPWR